MGLICLVRDSQILQKTTFFFAYIALQFSYPKPPIYRTLSSFFSVSYFLCIKRRKKSPKNTPKKHSLFTHPSRALACAHIFILQIKIVVMEQPPNLLPVRVSAVVQALALVAVRVRASVVARISQVLPSRRGSCSYVQFLAPCAPYASAL